MTDKRRALLALTKAELLELAKSLELSLSSRSTVEELRDEFSRSKRASLPRLLPLLSRDQLKAMCRALALSDAGKEKQLLIDRILGTSEEAEMPRTSKPTQQPDLPLGKAPDAPPEATKPTDPPPAQKTALLVRPPGLSVQPSGPLPPPVVTSPLPEPPPPDGASRVLSLPVEPRQPRLAWHGMARTALALAVPTQIVEIVRPGRAVDRGAQLAGVEARAVLERETEGLPPNRLIWTNDNLVALRTLLDEKDPETGDYRYRGRVDLVYIDPPFMVNSDFRADNAIDIELDDEEGVQAKKEPSLVEILAYKDTWRQGLDSFLTMLRERLKLLKELLAPTGSIYVHLDWHAVHYVKVMMDEMFGYESFCNEIIWKRRTGYMGTYNKFGSVTDSILLYSNGEKYHYHQVFGPSDPEYIKRFKFVDDKGRKYRLDNLTSPNYRENLRYVYKGYEPPPNGWAVSIEQMQRMEAEGRVDFPKDKNKRLQRRRFLDELEGEPVQSLWDDVPPVNPMAIEGLGYPTQKPIALLERIITASCPPGGLVLDCFVGSGTTCEAAERLGRRWIGIDNGKYGVHLARKRLIQLHGQPRPPEKPQYDYVDCKTCKNIERKERPQKSPGPFSVRPFTVENMGAYQRAEAWQSIQTSNSSPYRDAMIAVYGGKPVTGHRLLHGLKGNQWLHVGPLNNPVSLLQVWKIAEEASETEVHNVTILSADYDPLASQRDQIREETGVTVTIRIIPASAIDEVRRRIELARRDPDAAYESMAIPAFYAPLSIVLSAKVAGRSVTLSLERCEVDIESFLASQQPALKPLKDDMSAAARKKAQEEIDKWEQRRKNLMTWLRQAESWKKFVDFWAIDWDYGSRVGPDEKPIFETDWQSFRARRGKNAVDELLFEAELHYPRPGHYHIAARVTDVFGNDGIATVPVEVR